MTLLIADIAAWQQGLSLAQVRAAGIGAINVKISHGMGLRTVHPDAAAWVAGARAAGMGISTFHWLDDSALGADQAVHAHQQILALGGPAGMAHVVDVESTTSPPSEACYRDYVTTMTRLLGRPICTYTGGWWWRPRGWANRTPWLWAASNVGYLPGYPGDSSAHWAAGYGGWENLAVMQYSVTEIAGVRVSMSAVRDPAVWQAMTGGPMPSWVVVPALEALRYELNDAFPQRDKTSDGGIGDTSHGARPSGHNPDETGSPEDTDADHIDEVRARDFDSDLRHSTVDMEDVCQYLLRECRAGRITWIKYLIFNRRIWSADRGWVQRAYTGANPHDHHLHVSCQPDTASENSTRPVGLASLVEDDMPLTDAEIAKVAKAVWEHKLDIDVTAEGVNLQPAGGVLRYADYRAQRTDRKVDLASTKLDTVMTKVGATGDELSSFNARERDEVPITEERLAQLLDEAIPDTAGPLTPDEARAAVLAALRTAFAGEQA